MRILPLALPFALLLACGTAAPPPELPRSPAPAPSPSPAPVAVAPPAPPSPCAPASAHPVTVAARTGATLAIVGDGARRLLYTADGENHALHTLDADTLAELAVTELPGRPAQILPLADGRILVTIRDRNRLLVLEPGAGPEAPLGVRCERATYTEPFGLAVSPDGARVAVTAGWDHRLMLLDAARLEVERTVDLPAEPRGVLLSGDGETAYVAHLVGGVVSAVSLVRPEEAPRPIFARPAAPAEEKKKRGKGKEKEKERPPPVNPSQERAAAQGVALAEVSLGAGAEGAWPARIFVPMAASDPMRFGSQDTFPGVYGGAGGPAVIGAFVAVIDPRAGAPLGGEVAPLRQARPEDCILPRGIAAYEGRIFVACMGTNTVVELDARAVDPVSSERVRYPVAEGPTGVVVDPARRRALVLSDFAGEITVIDLAREVDPLAPEASTRRLRLARPEAAAISPVLARGRRLFHVTRDVRMSFDGRACASCHPDGRADGLTWATPDGPRQTILLAGREDRPGPFGWGGDHPVMKNHVLLTLKRLGGLGFEQNGTVADLDALLAYVRSLRLPSRAGALVDEGVPAQRARGKDLFFAGETGCAACHLGEGTDGKRHDVGSGAPREKSPQFETPALRGAAGSAPYFHDGRYPTLLDLLSDPRSKMGHTAALPLDDRRALAAYLESL